MTVALPAVVSVREAGGTFSSDLRGVRVVWRRELIRFSRDRTRMVTSLIQPVLFLFILGTGLSTIARSTAGVSFKTFMFPGIIGMTVLFTAVFSAMSIVWDREFGFLREMLVAPVKRWSIVLGKCFGGMTVATIQGVIFLCLAGAVGVPYSASDAGRARRRDGAHGLCPYGDSAFSSRPGYSRCSPSRSSSSSS